MAAEAPAEGSSSAAALAATRAPRPTLTPRADPNKTSLSHKVFGTVLIALIGFAIVGGVLRVISLAGSAAGGHLGPEHLLLVFVIGVGAYWFINRRRKKD